MWTQGLEESTITQYSSLTRELRKISREVIKQESYSHLETKNKKRNHVLVEDYKSRISFLVRPEIRNNNKRNLNVGSLESVIVLHGELNNQEDYSRGINVFNHKGTIRLVFGYVLANNQNFFEHINDYLDKNSRKVKEQIRSGNYTDFTHTMLKEIDTAMIKLKKSYGIYDS